MDSEVRIKQLEGLVICLQDQVDDLRERILTNYIADNEKIGWLERVVMRIRERASNTVKYNVPKVTHSKPISINAQLKKILGEK